MRYIDQQMPLRRADLEQMAAREGIGLVGVTRAAPMADYARYQKWTADGRAADMTYLTDHRGALRADPRLILPAAETVLVAGLLYNTGAPGTDRDASHGWISRYAWGSADYHDVLRAKLERLALAIESVTGPFERRVCVDTVPLLERSLAREAGLGWIGKNTCLINQQQGSWFFLGEILMSLPTSAFEELGAPPPDRCGTCRRCIDACPTEALSVETELDSARCISYWTIEARHAPPEALRTNIGNHVFGCDICQDVCPWNRRAGRSEEPGFSAVDAGPAALEVLAAMTADEFRERYRRTPLWRTKHRGLLRNAAIAMGNSGQARFRPLLDSLVRHEDDDVREAAAWAIAQLDG